MVARHNFDSSVEESFDFEFMSSAVVFISSVLSHFFVYGIITRVPVHVVAK